MSDHDEERPIAEDEASDWEIVSVDEPASARRSVVLSVRFSPHELRAVRDVAKSSGIAMGDVVREAVRRYLARRSSIVTTGYTTDHASANVLASSGIQTYGVGRTLEKNEVHAGSS